MLFRSIARALVHHPKIILADEPTGNLDSQNGAEVIALLKRISEEGTSVVLVTHNIEDARHADNVIFISDGVASMRGKLQPNEQVYGGTDSVEAKIEQMRKQGGLSAIPPKEEA